MDESPEKMLKTMKGEKSEWSDKLKQVTDVYNENFKDEMRKYQENLIGEEKKEAQKNKKEDLWYIQQIIFWWVTINN